MKVLLVLLIFLLGLNLTVNSQTYRFNNYTIEDGISQSFIYSINQDKNGYLWVGTGEGLFKFDGKTFISFTTTNGLAEDIITSSLTDSIGNLWFGHNEGGLTLFDHESFSTIKAGDSVNSTITDICWLGETVYFVAQNDGLFYVKNKRIYHIGNFDNTNFSSLRSLDKNNLLLGCQNGVLHIEKNETSEWVIKSTVLNENWISSIYVNKNPEEILVSTQSGGLFKLNLKNGKLESEPWGGDIDLSETQIKKIFKDKKGNVWLSTYGSGLIKIKYSEKNQKNQVIRYNKATGLSNDYIQTAFQDREGNIWIGTFGSGLSKLIDDYFTFYSNDISKFENKNTRAISISKNYRWYGLDNGLLRTSNIVESEDFFYTDTTGWINDAVTSLYERDSVLWVGTANNGIYCLKISTNEWRKINWPYGSLPNQINQISGNDKNIYVATNGGLIIQDILSDEHTLFNMEDGFAHNAIKTIFIDKDDVVWVGTQSRILYALKGSGKKPYEITTNGEIQVVDIDKDGLGSIWIATLESGIYKLQGDQFIHFSEEDGLKTNYCYAIEHDAHGNVWVGHRGGLSRISLNGEKIKTYDYKDGIKERVNERAIYQDEEKHLWFGTDNGPIRYDASAGKINDVSPAINLTHVTINGQKYSAKKTINLPYGDYRVLFSYIGISFRNPEKVTYRFKLEGYDDIYNDPTKDRIARYGKLTNGNYVFKVIACNEDQFCSEKPIIIKINIAAPIWKKWWFYAIIAILLTGIIVVIFQVRLKRIKATQKYLQVQLDIKTKELVEKAAHIEEINKDITSSINYAKRIQTSILPPIKLLHTLFPKSFVYFRPRDIVSGDFYYIERYANKLVVGCVDCTGHGVPGGFMSMIGSVTLRNIYNTNEARGVWQTPEKILEVLDSEIESILKQNSTHDDENNDFFKSREGMDMSLIEIDLETNEVLLSSAMRTSLIVQNNELNVVPGTKRPIGGGDTLTMPFELVHLKMLPGDGLYLFSDGYTDQFGGPKGRKLKMSGVKNIITTMKEKDSSQHESLVTNLFEEWLSDYDQIDDVLFIGIEF